MCASVCVLMCAGDLYRTRLSLSQQLYTTRQIMTVHVCEQVQIKCVLMKRMYEHTPGMHLYCQNQGARDA